MKRLLSVFLLLWCISAFGQRDKSFELGIFAGVSFYNGELNPWAQYSPDFTRPAFGIIGRKNLNRRWAIKFNAYYGRIAGDDSKVNQDANQTRNLSFESRLWDVGSQFEFNFVPFHPLDDKSSPITPYLFWGLSVFGFNPTTDLQGNQYELQPLKTEGQSRGYRRTSVGMPFGLGIKTRLNHRVLLGFEWGIRRTWTDYLDDVSTTYPDAGILDGVAADLSDRSFENVGPNGTNWGTQRGNPNRKDWYTFSGLTLTIRIGPKPNECYFQPGV
ncbi:MAG: DUF6089 family protein [Salibacteraceae bacterium]